MTLLRALAHAALIAFLFAPGSTYARGCTLHVRDGWVRLPPIEMPMLVGFGRIENRCPTPAAIVGVSSPAFADASLHESRIVDGVSRMRPLTELRIAPNAVAELSPGGIHLMLMRPRERLRPGARVVMEFTLRDGRVVSGEFLVRGPNP